MASLLPPSKWGAVLDFLLYEDVRSALLVSRIFRREAAAHVETMAVRTTKELDIPSAKRFPHVTTVLVLFMNDDDDSEDPSESEDLPIDTLTKIIPFLQSFPQVTHARINVADATFLAFCPDMPRFHEFLQYLAGAFEARALRLSDIDIFSGGCGVCENWPAHQLDEFEPVDCTICRRICQTFPFQNVLKFFSGCVEMWDRIDIIAERPGGREFLRSSQHLYYLLDRIVAIARTIPRGYEPNIFYIRSENTEKLHDHIRRFGCDPSELEWQEGGTPKCRSPFYNLAALRHIKIERATFDQLRSLGFDINANDFAGIVDECVEPDPEAVDMDYDSTSSEDYLDIYQG